MDATAAASPERARFDSNLPVTAAFPPARQAWSTVAVLALVTTFAELDQNILGLLIQQIKADFSLSDTEAGLLLGPAFVIFYAFIGLPLARFVDRSTRTTIMAIGVCVWSAATAACGLAQNFVQLFVARIMVGAGEAINGPASYSIVADCFPRERLPRAIAAMKIGTVAGGGLSLVLGGSLIWIIGEIGRPALPVIGAIRPWQAVFIAVGLPGVFVALLVSTVREPARRGLQLDRAKIRFRDAFHYLLGRFPLYGPMFIGLALGSLDIGFRAWGAAFFERTYGWSPAHYGIVSGTMSLVVTLFGLWLGTAIVEWMFARGQEDAPMRLLIYTRLVALPFAIAVPLMPTPWLALACSAVGMLTLGMSGPLINSILQIVTPNQIRGQVTAMYLFTFIIIGSGLAPLLTGLVNDVVFTAPDDLRWSILLLHVLFLPPALVVTWLGLIPYRAEVQRLNSLEIA